MVCNYTSPRMCWITIACFSKTNRKREKKKERKEKSFMHMQVGAARKGWGGIMGSFKGQIFESHRRLLWDNNILQVKYDRITNPQPRIRIYTFDILAFLGFTLDLGCHYHSHPHVIYLKGQRFTPACTGAGRRTLFIFRNVSRLITLAKGHPNILTKSAMPSLIIKTAIVRYILYWRDCLVWSYFRK